MHSDTAVREHFTTLTEFCCAKSALTPKTRLELSAIVSKFNVVPNMRGDMARQAKVEDGAWYFETYFPVDHVYLIPRGPADTVV